MRMQPASYHCSYTFIGTGYRARERPTSRWVGNMNTTLQRRTLAFVSATHLTLAHKLQLPQRPAWSCEPAPETKQIYEFYWICKTIPLQINSEVGAPGIDCFVALCLLLLAVCSILQRSMTPLCTPSTSRFPAGPVCNLADWKLSLKHWLTVPPINRFYLQKWQN